MSPTDDRTALSAAIDRQTARLRMPRRHVLMLLLAVEVLFLGVSNADRFHRPPAVTVDAPSRAGHVIT